jgi:hypothetical protein
MDFIETLNNEITQEIKKYSGKIEGLYSGFKEMNQMRNQQFAYKIVFGFFTSEYVLKLKNPTIYDDVDTIFLWGRKLLEVIIVVKYILYTNNFKTILEYCVRDRYEYLEGLLARQRADKKLFSYLNMPHNNMENQKEEMKQIILKYKNKPRKMPSMKKMAEAVDYLDEYDYFYKLSSKMLHFCPFTLNGDADFNSFVHKTGYIQRGIKYLEEIYKELDNIYQSIPKVS